MVAKKQHISILIPDGGSYEALKVIRCLGQVPEITTHLLVNSKKVLARYSRYCDKYHVQRINISDEKSSIEIIKKVAKENNIDLILPASPSYSELISKYRVTVSEVAAVPILPKEEIYRIALDKWLFYKFCQENKLPVIPSVLAIENKKLAVNNTVLESFDYPALLKPVFGMGGKGITKINNSSEMFGIINDKEKLNGDDKYLLQNYMSGQDYCLGVCCQNGKIVAIALQKSLYEPDNFFGPQKAIEYIHDDRIYELGKKVVSLLGWEGVAFIDFRIDKRDNSIKLLEVNPRFGRGLLGALHAGINFPYIWSLLSLSMEYKGKREGSGKYVYPSFYMSMLKDKLMFKKVPVKAGFSETGLGLLLSDPVPDILNSMYKLKFRFSNTHKTHN